MYTSPMSLFSRRKEHPLPDDWHGRLSEELYRRDESHATYVSTGLKALVDRAHDGLARKQTRPVSRLVQASMNTFVPLFVPASSRFPTLGDAAVGAFLLSAAETWEADRDEISRLASEGWEGVRRDDPANGAERFRAGMTLVGVTCCHHTQPQEKNSAPSFRPLGHYIVDSPAYARLLALEESLCDLDVLTFRVGERDEEEYRWNHGRAWHLGVSTQVLDSSGLL